MILSNLTDTSLLAQKSSWLCCSTVGYRSSEAAKQLAKEGVDAANLRGGILAWVRTEGGERRWQPSAQVPDVLGATHRWFSALSWGCTTGTMMLQQRVMHCLCNALAFVSMTNCDEGPGVAQAEDSLLVQTQAGQPLVRGPDDQPTTQVHTYSKRWELQGEGYEPVAYPNPKLRCGGTSMRDCNLVTFSRLASTQLACMEARKLGH